MLEYMTDDLDFKLQKAELPLQKEMIHLKQNQNSASIRFGKCLIYIKM